MSQTYEHPEIHWPKVNAYYSHRKGNLAEDVAKRQMHALAFDLGLTLGEIGYKIMDRTFTAADRLRIKIIEFHRDTLPHVDPDLYPPIIIVTIKLWKDTTTWPNSKTHYWRMRYTVTKPTFVG